MQILFITISLLLSLFVFLFSFYLFVKDDLTVLRKNRLLDTLFTYVFYTIIVGLLSARVVYVATHFKYNFLNPLVFLYVTHYAGMSFIGGVTGAALFLFFLHAKKKITFRVYDLITLSFLSSLPFGYLINFFMKNMNLPVTAGMVLFYIALFVFLLWLFLKRRMREGSITLLSLLAIALCFLIQDLLARGSYILQNVHPEDIFLLFVSFVLLFFFVQRQMLLRKILH